ncbi:MAG: hypothetical protein QXR87_04125 [Candidatus Hadarchaeales archaeon]
MMKKKVLVEVDGALWHRVRVRSVETEKKISEIVEAALQEYLQKSTRGEKTSTDDK